jgi:NAD(P)-dependent dehydrogenase (short-subunit alcohol dehydrogenase family)
MTLPSVNLQGHVALVTGANHGIGAATARALAACGVAVVVSYLRIPIRETVTFRSCIAETGQWTQSRS